MFSAVVHHLQRDVQPNSVSTMRANRQVICWPAEGEIGVLFLAHVGHLPVILGVASGICTHAYVFLAFDISAGRRHAHWSVTFFALCGFTIKIVFTTWSWETYLSEFFSSDVSVSGRHGVMSPSWLPPTEEAFSNSHFLPIFRLPDVSLVHQRTIKASLKILIGLVYRVWAGDVGCSI